MTIPWSCAIGLVSLVLATTALEAQKTLRVPAQYKTIQAAVNAAKDKDVVLVSPGIYREQVTINRKDIRVTGLHGPHATTIAAPTTTLKNQSMVTVWGKSHATILEGFTVMGGSCDAGGGILVAGPAVVRSNIVTGNTAHHHGGGIAAMGTRPIVENNMICLNVAFTPKNIGDGIHVDALDAVIAGNVICHNNTPFWPGEGIRLTEYASAFITNNTIYGNNKVGVAIHGAVATLTNNIIWNNGIYANPKLQIYAVEGTNNNYTTLVVQYNMLEGGHKGIQIPTPWRVTLTYGPWNFTGTPVFADPARGDFHQNRPFSTQDFGLANAPGLPATDFEGDPRVVGGKVDLGADEDHPHLYHVGSTSPGTTIRFRVIGKTGDVVFLGLSSALLGQPLTVPGYTGALHLHPTNLVVLPVGKIGSGYLEFPLQLPKAMPRIFIATQALLGSRFSNVHGIQVH